MKKLMLFYGLILALFSASGQSIRDYSTKDTKDYKIFLRPFKAELRVPQVPGQTSTPKQFLGNIDLDTLVKSVAEKVVINPVFTGPTTISKTGQTVSSTTPSGGFFLKNPDVSYTGIEMGVGNPVVGGAWIQARSPSNTTGQILTLNPGGGNVGVAITNGAKTLSVNGSIGFGLLASKDLQTELDTKAAKNNPAFTGNSVFTGNVSISNIFSANTVNGATVNADVLQADQSNANILQVQDAFQYPHTSKGTGKFLIDQDGQGNAFWSFVPFNSLTEKPTTISGYGITDFYTLGDSRYSQKVEGKSFSANDFTNSYKQKIDSLNYKLQNVTSINDLKSYMGSPSAFFDGSYWDKKFGNVPSNGGDFAGTIINITTAWYWERRYESLNVKFFGAKGDGVTDDIIPINNCINYAKTVSVNVFFPQGVYVISQPILHYARVKLIGMGIWSDNVSKIRLKAGSNCVMLKAGRAIDGTSNSFMSLENLVFDGNSAQQTTENEGVQFWGQYVGSNIKNVLITNVFGIALSLNAGDDIQLDHVWLLGNKSSSGYGMTINNGLTTGYDGTMNLNHIYIEWQRKTTDPTIDVYNSANDNKKSTGLYINRAITCNINDIHFEYCGQGIFLENNATVIIQNCFGGNMGRTAFDNEAMIVLANGSGARTMKINNGLAISANTTYKWVDMLDKSGSNLNYFLSTPTTTVAGFLTGYAYSNIGANATTKFEADLTVANALTIQGTGNYTPQKLQINANGTTKGGFWKQNSISYIFGSSSGQSADKNFLTINSYGNAGDNIVLNAPLTLGNRGDGANLGSGNIMLLNNNPAYTFGGNRVYNFVTTFSGSGAPTTTPDWVGQTYIDVTNNQMYFAKGIASSADWSINYKQKNIDDIFLEQSQINSQPAFRIQNGTKNSYIRQNAFKTIFGSNVGQSADKDFITINSYGNAGDFISLNAPLALGNRSDGANLVAGNIMLLNNNPAYTFGGNRVYNFVTTFSGSGVPTTTPDWIGQTYIDVTNNRKYFAKGISSSADWIITGNATLSASQTFTGSNTFQVGTASGITINSGNTAANNRIFMPTAGVEIQTNDPSGTGTILSLFSTANEKFRFNQSGSFLVGTTSDIATSTFTVASTTKGVLLPRMTTSQRDAISAPAEGLEIYNLTTHTKDFYNGTVWKTITTN